MIFHALRRLALACLCLVALAQQGAAQGRDAVRVYMFGNSLVNFAEGGAQANVPHWLDAMAAADGRGFAVDGQFGFLRNFATDLPPLASWGFPGVRGAWNPDRGRFSEAGFDAVILTPANFIQYQPPDRPYDGDNPDGLSPLDAALRTVDWLATNAPGARILVYEGWADMAGMNISYPPDAGGLARYHAANLGAYHDWFVAFTTALADARPDADIRLLPVAPLLAELLTSDLLADIPATALYVDDAPHGTPTLYLLAAMVSYATLFGAPPPPMDIPTEVHPELRAAYDPVAQWIFERVTALGLLSERAVQRTTEPATRATEAEAATVPTEPAQATGAAAPQARATSTTETAPAATRPSDDGFVPPPPGLRPQGAPALAMGLNGIADWSTQHPFIDLMKTARGWIGHSADTWGAMPHDTLWAEGHLDPQGWPLRIPAGIDRLESFILTDQPEAAKHLAGRYIVTYDGTGDLTVAGRASRVRREPGVIRFRYSPGEGLVALTLRATDPADPVRNIRVIREDHADLDAAGVLFNPHWIARITDLRALRFMDWMGTNGSTITSWDDRPRLDDATWTRRGVPLPVMLALANQVRADAWFTLPHQADDDYLRRFATQVRDGLDPALKAYVEYSNEVWNFIFPQAHWAAEQARAAWGDHDTGWMQFYGLRAAQVMRIFTEVFGPGAEDRLVRVMATHTGWQGLEEAILEAPLAVADLGAPPAEHFDAYAVTGYFGFEMGTDEAAPRLRTWLDASEAAARERGEAQGLRRVALREHIRKTRFDTAMAPLAAALRDGSLRELTEEVFPYHAAQAGRAGLALVMYEGGTHVAGHGAQVNDDRLTEFLRHFNYSSEMAALYDQLLAGWRAAGGTLFNAFVDVAPATQWGSWGALRHLDDANPRWDVLMAHNARAPTDWQPREAGVFSDGLTLQGRDGPDRIKGTDRVDILLGGPGDDRLTSGGGTADYLHGGPGRDIAILPGFAEDWRFERDGARIVGTGLNDRVSLAGIEVIGFEASPTDAQQVEALVD